MFTFRLNSYRLFQYLLILYVSCEVICGQTIEKCAANGEFCINHWDCCSNSCLSYKYRCLRSYNNNPNPPVDTRPTATLEQILEQNFGTANTVPVTQPKPYFLVRIDNDNDVAATEIKETSTVAYERQSDETTLKTPVNRDEIAADKIDVISDETTETYKEINNAATQTTFQRSTEKPKCLEIGDKCYRNEECCSTLCHGYLHQCVT